MFTIGRNFHVIHMSAEIEALPRPLRKTVRTLLSTQWALMGLYTVLLIFPGDGRKRPPAGFSALMRT